MNNINRSAAQRKNSPTPRPPISSDFIPFRMPRGDFAKWWSLTHVAIGVYGILCQLPGVSRGGWHGSINELVRLCKTMGSKSIRWRRVKEAVDELVERGFLLTQPYGRSLTSFVIPVAAAEASAVPADIPLPQAIQPSPESGDPLAENRRASITTVEVNVQTTTTASAPSSPPKLEPVAPAPEVQAVVADADTREAAEEQAAAGAREVVPATTSTPDSLASSPAPKQQPSIVSTTPEIEAVVADARTVTGGQASRTALLNCIRAFGIDVVRRQVDWFPYRDSSWAKNGPGAALWSYIKDDWIEPPALAARRREAEEAQAAAAKKRLEAQRSASRDAAAELAFANLGAKEQEAIKAEVRQEMGLFYQGEDHAFQAMLRARALAWREMAA